MNSTERIRATVEEKPIDRIAFSGWWHMPMVDNNIKDFTKATIDYTENNGFDFVKAMYNGYFMTHAYGADITYSCDPTQWAGKINRYPLLHPHDYEILKPLDVKNSTLMNQVEFTKNLVDHYKGTKPVLATLFTPLTFLKEMTSAGVTHSTEKMMKYSKRELHIALEAMTETCINFVKELLKVGIDGLFYATHFITSDCITDEEYAEFCRPYDLAVLEALKGSDAWFTMFHLHERDNLMFEKCCDYPVEAFNWEDNAADERTRLSISKVRSMTDKVIIGGIDQTVDFFSQGNNRNAIKEVLKRRLENALKETGGRKFIFAPGCGIPTTISGYEMTLIQEVVNEML